MIYAAALKAAYPCLEEEVERVCGPAPWIVRSSGSEDFADHVNAGGYESLICPDSEVLIKCVSAVALSGSTEHARRQLALSERYDYDVPIPCFVQPLLNIDVSSDVDVDQSPCVGEEVLEQMEATCNELMRGFDFVAIDCEWGLETDLGFVSVTTVMPRNPTLMNVAHTMGFGFASSQNTGSMSTSLVLRPARSNLRLWRACNLRVTTVRRLHLLQARPAYFDEAFRDRSVLTDVSRETLMGRYHAVEAVLLLLGAKSSGRALVAPNLMSAWRRYLSLTLEEQSELAVVIVDEGNAEEHAGIMFRQQKITCVRMETRRMPVGIDCVVFDRNVCICGDPNMLRLIQSELRRELVLPDDCALVFTGEVLMPSGDLVRECVEGLSQMQRLPVAQEVRERLLAASEQPICSRWIQRSDGVVESPSLLAAISRSKYAKWAGECFELTEFAREYQRASRIAQGASHLELGKLLAISSVTRALVESGDLRIVMALLDCDAATSWVPQPTLRRLLEAASAQLANLQRGAAVLILQCVAFVRKECARLPVYVEDDAISYLNELAHDLEDGLLVEAIVSVRALELPIVSEILLMRQTVKNAAVLEPVDRFRRSLASFRGVVSGGEGAVKVLKQVNDSYLTLRTVLCRAGLKNVAEQIRGSLVETYDASLKALLGRIVEQRDISTYDKYLVVMRCWIEVLSVESVAERDATVFSCLKIWLQQWTAEPIPKSFDIQDRNWQYEFDALCISGQTPQRYENPHVVHNLLHQYSLATLRIDTQKLTVRIRALDHFCSTFSGRSTRILRYERELLEIQIPMGTHKASYVFTPREIYLEWSEPPDCAEGEIARILAFEVFLHRFRAWMFPGLTLRREQVVGTWTLIIRLNTQGPGPWDFKDIWDFVVATRLLFDASYDFSYVANEAVDGFGDRFNGAEWKTIITMLMRHRALLDDTSQYVALHAQPLSSTVATIARSGVIRGLFLRCLRRGFGYCRSLIDRYAHWLNMKSGHCGKWHNRYEALRQASLFLSVMWPREVLSELAGRSVFNVGDELLAACLFKRSDLRSELQQLAVRDSSALSGMWELIVRHAPEIAVSALGAPSLATQLVDTGVRFRRAKHFLIAQFSDSLPVNVLASLLQGLDAIPLGQTADAERAIKDQIMKRGTVCRFQLEKGIDWTTLCHS